MPLSVGRFGLWYCLIIIIVFLIPNMEPYQSFRANHFKNSTKTSMIEDISRNMGYVVCAGNKHRVDVQRTLYYLRHIWRSHLPFVIAHCNELTTEFQTHLKSLDSNIILLDLCPEDQTSTIFSMSRAEAQKKLRGFFCKVAALLKSPFEETMLLDLDTVWFKNPERLFYSKSYLLNKSLFFRDRLYQYEIHGGRIAPDEILDMLSLDMNHGYHKLFAKEELLQLFHGNGVNMYFANAANYTYPQYNEHQDSSSLLVHKHYHPKLMDKLASWIQSFALGYGDKEIFWVASTIAREAYTWEPFLAGQYGDCMGLIIQFDPDDAFISDPTHALPMYMNAEYMVENGLKVVGDYIQYVMTKPILATHALKNLSVAQHMRSFEQPYEYHGCTCASFDCCALKKHVNYHLLLSQWITISIRPSNCVPIYVKHLTTMNKIFVDKLGVTPKECRIIGCPHLPIISYPLENASPKLKICEPISFSLNSLNDSTLFELAMKARKEAFI